MQADFAVELGRDDETLEFPWADPEGKLHWLDAKRQPELLDKIPEAIRFPELREFLAAANSPSSILESAKSEAWASGEIHPEEEIYGRPCKFGGYVDLVFEAAAPRFCYTEHERLLKQWTALLKRAPEIPASAQFLLRRCYFRDGEGIREGFYLTLYVFGYGSDEAKARQQWGIALKLAANAMTQLSWRQPSR